MSNPATSRIRQRIAAEAARIIATESLGNYAAAKNKAAARLGVKNKSLPSNTEVAAALEQHQQLFGGAQHESLQHELRQAALDIMHYFAAFRPRLAGPVLEGTADQHSRICLHLFCDENDALIRLLLDRGMDYQQELRRIRWHDGSFRDVEIVLLESENYRYELAVYGLQQLRQAPPCPITGRPQRRASRRELKVLLNEADKPADQRLSMGW